MKISKVIKNHKLYFRTHKGELKRLDKESLDLYVWAIKFYFNEGGKDLYDKKNSGVVHHQMLRSVDCRIPESLHDQFDSICKGGKSFEVSYEGSWRPLINFVK